MSTHKFILSSLMLGLGLQLAVAAPILISAGAYAKEGSAPWKPTVKGPLSKEIIRSVILKHIGEVKRCYEVELDKDESLAGQVMMNFTISTEGKVTESRLEQSTLRNGAAEKCIVEAVRGWEFPKPQGGTVAVSYPFLLAVSGEDKDKAAAAAKQ